MSAPFIQVLGVYSLPVTVQLIQEQTDILYGSELTRKVRQVAEQSAQEQLESTVLVEVLIQNRNDRFQVGDFCQPCEGKPRENWQVAWAEVYLSVNGETRLEQPRWPGLPEEKNFRAAFFIHYWDERQPLLSTYGELTCPAVQEMPERLRRLVQYELVD